MIPNQGVAGAREHAPVPLLRFGHEAQEQLLGGESFHQPLSIRPIGLAAFGGAVGLCVGQMQGEMRLPLAPHRTPVLGRTFHDYFRHFGLLEDHPQSFQLRLPCPELALL